MAKTIIDVEINDSKFLEFKSLFDDYKKSLEETPEAWSDANSEMSNATESSRALTNDAKDRLSLFQHLASEEQKANTEQKKRNEEQRKAAETRKKSDLETIKRWKEVAGSIAHATLQLTKFAAVGLGLASGASAFGFNKLANDASYARFTAMGLGVSSGAMQAANINYQSAIANPTQALAAVRDAQQDLSKQKLFVTAGIQNYQNKSSEQLLPELMVAAQKLAKQTPQGQLAQTAQAYGYTDVFSMEDLTRFKQMSEAEMQAMIARQQQDAKNLAVNDSTLKSYQDLQKQWDRFTQEMENTWLKALEPLAPTLTKFSESVSTAFETLMKSDSIAPMIDGLGKALTDFSKYLTSSEFSSDVDTFMHWLDVASGYIAKFAKGLGIVADTLGLGSETTLTGSQYRAIDKSGLSLDMREAATTWLENPSDQSNTYKIQEFAKQAEEAAKTDTQVYEKLRKLGIDIGKPMTEAEYKKARDEEFQRMSGQYLDKMGDKFTGALKSWWDSTKETAGEVAGGALNAVIPTASASESSYNNANDFSLLNKSTSNKDRKTSDLSIKVVEYMMNKGWSKEQAIGIAANLQEESAFNTTAVGDKMKKDKKTGKWIPREQSGWAYGIAQWREGRATKFQEMYGHHLKDATLKEQLDYYDWELRNKKGEEKARNAMLSARTTEEAVRAGVYFERPADQVAANQSRNKIANEIKAKLGRQLNISQSDYKGTPFVTKKDESGNLITVKQQQIKDSYAIKKPTADQQKSVMFQQQGGVYESTANRVQVMVNNSTGGNAVVSAVSL